MKQIDYKTYTKPSDFVKFGEGRTVIQIISNGILVKKHGMKTAQRYVPLGICTEKPDCQYCKDGNEPKMKWSWIVCLPDSKEVKLLDAGVMIGNQICEIAKVQGDPQEYELVITRSGTGRQTKYTVSKGDKCKLNPIDLKLFEPQKMFLKNKYFK